MLNWECWRSFTSFLQNIVLQAKTTKWKLTQTVSFLAFADKEKHLFLYPRTEKERVGIIARQRLWQYTFTTDICFNLFCHTFGLKHRKHEKRNCELLKGKFHCTEKFCLCRKANCSYSFCSNKWNFISEGANKLIFEDNGDAPMANIGKFCRKQKT